MESDTENKKKQQENSLVKKVLGLGYWVNGFRSFPWLGVNYFFLKDGDPSTLQLLKNSSAIPMIAKPLYGFLSDSFRIAGQHRLPYIALGAFLQALSWLAIAFFAQTSISAFAISSYLMLSNLGASLTEVGNDAIVAQVGKGPTNSGEIQSYVWFVFSVGGILGNFLGGIFIDLISSEATFLIFGLLSALQFLVTVCVHENSLNLPKSSSSNVGFTKQVSDISIALQKREIVAPILWFAASCAVIPTLTETMFFYQTQYQNIDSTILGMSRVFGQVASLVWSVIYKRYLKSVPPRKLIITLQTTLAMFMLLDVLYAKGFFHEIGLPDWIYVIIISGLLKVLFLFKNLPFNVLLAQLCPPGYEGSIMAFLASATSVATIISGYLGVALASYMGITRTDFSGFPVALLIQAGCTLIPLYWSSCIPQNAPKTTTATTTEEEEESVLIKQSEP